mmetsp:Transcript_32681/g.79263  ORF Transcript_32681/g.79263 Transcript_32681/m.79263 type:complete len:204 (-) Transcript_32681:1966-2577(-)
MTTTSGRMTTHHHHWLLLGSKRANMMHSLCPSTIPRIITKYCCNGHGWWYSCYPPITIMQDLSLEVLTMSDLPPLKPWSFQNPFGRKIMKSSNPLCLMNPWWLACPKTAMNQTRILKRNVANHSAWTQISCAFRKMSYTIWLLLLLLAECYWIRRKMGSQWMPPAWHPPNCFNIFKNTNKKQDLVYHGSNSTAYNEPTNLPKG